MTDKRKPTAGKSTRSKRASSPKGSKAGPGRRPAKGEKPSTDANLSGLVSDVAQQLVTGALQFASLTSGAPMRMARSLLLKPEQRKMLGPDRLKLMHDTGQYLREVRELAGLTVSDLGAAIELKDESLLKAVEAGTATLSVELILRLAALLARNDPLPFVIRMMRTYNPEMWQVLENWGLGRLPLQVERERQFLNVYRSRDVARQLDDEAFAKVLAFTQSAFDMALHFAQQGDEDT